MYGVLRKLGECGVAVVCSAGNDSTERPVYPAAFTPWLDGNGTVQRERDVVPIVSVGALNPNKTTDALFSNAGPWVRTYARGAAVMSTIPPTFQGGFNAAASIELHGRPRASIDPDDYGSGFALWSGTSFSAPFFAGLLASEMVDGIVPSDDRRAAAVARGWKAVSARTTLKRPD
jgi:subtilisin family serine protease